MEENNLDEYLQNLARLYDISCLGDNWNGDNAKKIPWDVIGKAQSLLYRYRFNEETEIYVIADEAIQFDWRDKDKNYLEVEIHKDDVRIYSCNNECETTYQSIIDGYDENEISNIIDDFFSKKSRFKTLPNLI